MSFATGNGSCPYCAGPLDAEGLCGTCLDGAFDERPALSADGAMARPVGPRAMAPEPRVSAPEPQVPAPEPPAREPEPRVPAAPKSSGPSRGPGVEPVSRTAPARDDWSLELDERALVTVRPPSVELPPPPEEHTETRRRRWPWVLAGLAALSIAIAVGAGSTARQALEALFEKHFASKPERSSAAGDEGKDGGKSERALPPGLGGEILMIDSVPSGAEVYLGDELLGVTPLAVDNPYGAGEQFEVTLKKAGYQPAVARAGGGGPAQLDVKLKRRR